MYDFLRVDGRKELLLDYAHQKIAFGPSRFRRVSRGWRIPFVATWQRQGEKCLMKFERRLRSDLLSLVLVEVQAEQVGGPANAHYSLRQKVEMMARNVGLLFGNLRLEF